MVQVHNPLEGDQPELTIDLHDGSEEQIAICIAHHNRPEYLNLLLQSIAIASYNNNYEIIVVDNASTDTAALEFLDEIERSDIKLIRNKKNVYWGPAMNQAVEAASKNAKYFVFMHCDVVILNQGWLDLLINVSESQNSGLVGVDVQSYMVLGQKINFVQEWLMLTTRECWNEAGPFPEKLPLIGPSFIYTMKAQTLGYKPQVMKNTIAHHWRMFSLNINDWEMLTERATALLPQLMSEITNKNVTTIR